MMRKTLFATILAITPCILSAQQNNNDDMEQSDKLLNQSYIIAAESTVAPIDQHIGSNTPREQLHDISTQIELDHNIASGEELSNEEFTTVGERTLPKELQEKLENRPEQDQTLTKKQIKLRKKLEDGVQVSFSADPSYYLPSHYHFLRSVSPSGDSVELHDGSTWKVPFEDFYKLMHWKSGEIIVIKPKRSYKPTFAYILHNQTQNQVAEANLFLGPHPDGHHSHWVAAKDSYRRLVYLEDGSCWKISEADTLFFNKWHIKDYIISGMNNSLWSSHNNILINVNMNHFVRANKVQ